MKVLWLLTSFAAVGAGMVGINGVLSATSAPQQAAAAAISVAIAIIPYCFTRACEKLANEEVDRLAMQLKKLNETLEVHTKLLAEIANASAQTMA